MMIGGREKIGGDASEGARGGEVAEGGVGADFGYGQQGGNRGEKATGSECSERSFRCRCKKAGEGSCEGAGGSSGFPIAELLT